MPNVLFISSKQQICFCKLNSNEFSNSYTTLRKVCHEVSKILSATLNYSLIRGNFPFQPHRKKTINHRSPPPSPDFSIHYDCSFFSKKSKYIYCISIYFVIKNKLINFTPRAHYRWFVCGYKIQPGLIKRVICILYRVCIFYSLYAYYVCCMRV